MNLPIEIINAVQQKNCVLFAGPGFAREAIEALGRDIPDDLMLAKAMGWKRPKRLMALAKDEMPQIRPSLLRSCSRVKGVHCT